MARASGTSVTLLRAHHALLMQSDQAALRCPNAMMITTMVMVKVVQWN